MADAVDRAVVSTASAAEAGIGSILRRFSSERGNADATTASTPRKETDAHARTPTTNSSALPPKTPFAKTPMQTPMKTPMQTPMGGSPGLYDGIDDVGEEETPVVDRKERRARARMDSSG